MLSCESAMEDRFVIEANAPGVYNGLRAYLKTTDETGQLINIDTAMIVNETFSFEGKRDEPSLEFIFIDSHNGNIPIIVENAMIEILVEKDSLQTSKITGTDNNKDFTSFITHGNTLSRKRENLMEALRNATGANHDNDKINSIGSQIKRIDSTILNAPIDFIKEHKDSYFSLLLLENLTHRRQLDLDVLENGYNNLSQSFKTTKPGKKISDYIVTQKALKEQEKSNLKIGDIAPNFTGGTPDGKTLSLNDIKGKVTIIDFWASWCGPCRRENPNVVKMYQKYHSKGLEIIGVSLDRNGQQDRWQKAIADDKLAWHHVSNLQFWQDPIARLYNVSSIPATFILDESGKIIAKNLRGQDLENKVAELLN